MTDEAIEAYEAEQDGHLRRLKRRSKNAEQEVYGAIQNLASCYNQQRMMLLVTVMSSAAVCVLAIVILSIMFVFHGNQ